MKNKIRVQIYPRVRAQIAAQARYYRSEVEGAGGERLAARFIKAVKQEIQSLNRFPERGATFRFITAPHGPLRWVSVKGFRKFLIFYEYEAATTVVRVVNLRHGAMDPETLLD